MRFGRLLLPACCTFVRLMAPSWTRQHAASHCRWWSNFCDALCAALGKMKIPFHTFPMCQITLGAPSKPCRALSDAGCACRSETLHSHLVRLLVHLLYHVGQGIRSRHEHPLVLSMLSFLGMLLLYVHATEPLRDCTRCRRGATKGAICQRTAPT